MTAIGPMTALELIAAERKRQIEQEGYTPGHDNQHAEGELAKAAAAYALQAFRLTSGQAVTAYGYSRVPIAWPFGLQGWKPSDDPVRNLVKAGALIVAEIERLQRAQSQKLD